MNQTKTKPAKKEDEPKYKPIKTEGDIKAVKPLDKDYRVGCGNNLWLRVRVSGRKTFVVRRKEGTKTRSFTLGDYPTVSLKHARELTITRKTPGEASMSDLVKQYKSAVISHHARPEQFAAYEKRIIAAFGSSVKVTTVTAKILSALVGESRGTPRAADSLRSHLKAMFSLAIELGWREDNPATVIGKRVTGYKYVPSKRVLTSDEIKQLWAWEGRNAAILRFLLLTGLRIGEGQSGYADGDLWRIDKTKNGKPHWVFMTPTAKAQLDEPFDCSTTNVQAWTRRKQKLAPTAWTPHDLRRTFASLAQDNGVLPHVIEMCLNHALEGMLAVYARGEMTKERIEAANTVERVVLAIVAKPASAAKPSNVVKLRRAAK